MNAIRSFRVVTTASRKPVEQPGVRWATVSADQSKGPRRGFTLIEMLTVVVIIGILASLITAAAIAARRRAKIAVISLEISQLHMALKAYKEKYGDYPPDFFGVGPDYPDAIRIPARAAVLRHLAKAFPRYIPGTPSGSTEADLWERLQDDVEMANPLLNISTLTPASALVFWVGGLPATDGSGKLSGFSANPRNPFDNSASRLPPLFDFDQRRLIFDLASPNLAERWPRYYPASSNNRGRPPYVYFRPRIDRDSGRREYGVRPIKPLQQFYYQHTDVDICVPYLESIPPGSPPPAFPGTVRNWMNPKTFQIIAAGLDEKFSSSPKHEFRYARTGVNFCPLGYDYDNLTNFTGGTLEDEMQ